MGDQIPAGPVTWPHVAVSDKPSDDDLASPLQRLLQDLDLLGTKEDQAKADKASTAITGSLPVSVSILEAGATAASKGWSTVIAALGGGAAVWAAVENFWKGQASGTRGILTIAVAVVIAACALAVALIMSADVRARGRGTTALYYARAAVASEFLRGATVVSTAAAQPAGAALPNTATKDDQLSATLAEVKTAQGQVSDVSKDLQNGILALAIAQAGDSGVQVTLTSGGTGQASKLTRTDAGTWRFRLGDRTWMPVSEIASFGKEV